MWIMNLLVGVSIAVSSLVMILFQFVKNRSNRGQDNLRSKLLPWILLCLVVTVFVNVVCLQTLSVYSLIYDIVLALCPVMLLSMTAWNGCSMQMRSFILYMVIALLTIIVYVLLSLEVISDIPMFFYVFASFAAVLIMTVFLIWEIWRFLYNVKVVLRSGTVWHTVCLSIEIVYLMLISLFVCAVMGTACICGNVESAYAYIPLVALWFTLLALSFRINTESAMIFCHRMERRILESLKVAVVEVPNDVTRTDTAYQEIYDRIVAYFETAKPYLRSDLIIDDLVKVVFSNKLYISRAISQITGRNFCQFVTYYRIMYSVEAFRANPELKVTELANLSGFNSLVSFSMAFRLYMNENPSDWIRKERNRKAKSGLMSIN